MAPDGNVPGVSDDQPAALTDPFAELARLSSVVPADAADQRGWPVWEQWLPRVLAVTGQMPQDRVLPVDDAHRLAWLLTTAGTYLRARGDAPTARPLQLRAVLVVRDTVGVDDPAYGAALMELALTMDHLGERRDAHDLFADVLSRRRRLLGPAHPDTLLTAYHAAGLLADLGDLAAALAVDTETLDLARATLGPDHPLTLRVASNLGADLVQVGDLPRAAALMSDVLARRRHLLGPDDPQTLSSAHGLAVVAVSLRDESRVRDLTADTLERRRRVLGGDHPTTLESAHLHGMVLNACGDGAVARGLHEDTLARRVRVLGPDHPWSRQSAAAVAACAS